jgi:hypothetical protein
MLLATMAGCRAPSPAPALEPTVAVEGPAPVRPAVARFRLPEQLPLTTYRVEQRARLALDGRTVAAAETVDLDGRVTVLLRRADEGWLDGSATVDSISQRASPTVATAAPDAATDRTPPGAGASTASLSLQLRLDPSTWSAQPLSATPNSCDRDDAAAALARELLVRVPRDVAVGDRWRDSLPSTTCRAGIPVTVVTIVESRLAELRAGTDGAPLLVVHRTLSTHLTGARRLPWSRLEVFGDGQGSAVVQLDAVRGMPVTIDGESVLQLRVLDGTLPDAPRQHAVTQRTILTVRIAR